MTGDTTTPNLPLSVAILERVDRQCLAFEAAWLDGQSVRVEDFLGDAQGTERAKLFCELVLLEIDYRQRTGQRPTQQEYESRFPGDTQLVAAAFDTLAASESSERSGSLPGDTVGARSSDTARYRLLRRHAQGGLGDVFVALDQELNREVALKEIRPRHADNVSSRARFALEAEVTGSLEHPGIVPVHGLGVHADGRPYYVMQLIRGENLQAAIDRFHHSQLSPTARSIEFRRMIRKLIDVCQTIEYAHSQGVLHRDIKPANVMLGKYGETLVVDWGLAKTRRFGEGDRPAADEAGAEPFELVRPAGAGSAPTMAGAAIGTPVFMSPEQAAGELDQLGPPSDVYGLGATLYVVLTGRAPFAGDAATILRRVREGDLERPRSVNTKAEVPPPLEAICLKAMALDPTNRYDSARSLANDLEAWSADEPVTAYRDPLAASVWRWIRHHQAPALATATAMLVALGAMGIGAAILGTKNTELRAANEREIAAKVRSEQRLDLALAAVEQYYTGVSKELLLEEPRLAGLRTQLLSVPLEFYERLSRDLQGDSTPASRAALADAYFAIASITQYSGSHESALTSCQQSIEILEALTAKFPGNAPYRASLMESLTQLAELQRGAGQLDAALASFRRALSLAVELVSDHPEIAEHESWLAKCHNNVATALAKLGDLPEAIESCEQALRIHEALAKKHPDDTHFPNDIAKHHANLAYFLHLMGDPKEALPHAESAVEIHQQLASIDAESTKYHHELASDFFNRGSLQATLGDLERALDDLQMAIQIEEELAQRQPNVSRYHQSLTRYYNRLSNLQWNADDHEASLRSLDRSIKIGARLVARDPDVVENAISLGGSYCNRGNHELSLGNAEAALPWYVNAIETLQRAVREDRQSPMAQTYLRNAHRGHAASLTELQRYDEALDSWDQAIEYGPSVRTFLQLARARTQTLAGNHAIGVDAAEHCLADVATDEISYRVARVLALASESVKCDESLSSEQKADLSSQYGDRAIELLAEARQGGFFSTPGREELLNTSDDFAPLRTRDDFQSLLGKPDATE